MMEEEHCLHDLHMMYDWLDCHRGTAQAGDAAGAAAAGLTPAAAWTRCTVADADGPAFLVLVAR